MNRRNFLSSAATAAILPPFAAAQPCPAVGITAIAFDAFPILDPRPIGAACERAFPTRGKELFGLWRTRQFEYQWLRALGGRYEDFWSTTSAALDHACDALGLGASAAVRDELMQEYLRLNSWPDVPAALRRLKADGLDLAFLSNATRPILEGGLRRAGLADLFDEVISTDVIASYKPDPRAYELGVKVLRRPKEQILFVAFAGWDAAGAGWFGYPVYWNNRLGAAEERLDATADARGPTLDGLTSYLRG